MATLALTAIVGIGLNVLLGLDRPGVVRPRRLLRHRRLHGGDPDDGREARASGSRCRWRWRSPALVGALLALPALRVRGPVPRDGDHRLRLHRRARRGRSGAALTGGQNGIMGMPAIQRRSASTFGERGVALLAIALAAALLLRASGACRAQPWGAAMRAVKDSEIAAESIGLEPGGDQDARLRALGRLRRASPAPCSRRSRASSRPRPSRSSQSILFVLVVIVGGAGTRERPAGRRRRSWCCCPRCSRASPSTGCCSSARCCWSCCGSRPKGIVGEVGALVRAAAREPSPRRPQSRARDDAAAGAPLAGRGPHHRLRRREGGRPASRFDAQPGRGHQPDRPERRRQDDGAQHAGRLLSPRRRHACRLGDQDDRRAGRPRASRAPASRAPTRPRSSSAA